MSLAPTSIRRNAVCMAVIISNGVRTHVGKLRPSRTHLVSDCCASGINWRSNSTVASSPKPALHSRCRSARRRHGAPSPRGSPHRASIRKAPTRNATWKPGDQGAHAVGSGWHVAERRQGVRGGVRGEGREHRQPDRATELLRRVEQPRRKARRPRRPTLVVAIRVIGTKVSPMPTAMIIRPGQQVTEVGSRHRDSAQDDESHRRDRHAR